jgi:acetyltransferase-like isoleucine patch superfamily enzyme
MYRFFNKLNASAYISPFSYVRNHRNISIGLKTYINANVVLWPVELCIGNYTEINPGTCIYGRVIIGSYVMIAPNVMIAGGNHSKLLNNVPMIFQKCTEKGIIIEDDVWIGANSVILDGVTIKKGAVVAAGSIVTKNVQSNAIYAGNPARIIKFRN